MTNTHPLDALAAVECTHDRHKTMCAPCAADAVRPEMERLNAEGKRLFARINEEIAGHRATLNTAVEQRERADQAEASIARVHDVHYSITREGKEWCNACSSITGHHYMPYPCPTIRALNEPEGDQP